MGEENHRTGARRDRERILNKGCITIRKGNKREKREEGERKEEEKRQGEAEG